MRSTATSTRRVHAVGALLRSLRVLRAPRAPRGARARPPRGFRGPRGANSRHGWLWQEALSNTEAGKLREASIGFGAMPPGAHLAGRALWYGYSGPGAALGISWTALGRGMELEGGTEAELGRGVQRC